MTLEPAQELKTPNAKQYPIIQIQMIKTKGCPNFMCEFNGAVGGTSGSRSDRKQEPAPTQGEPTSHSDEESLCSLEGSLHRGS